MADILKLARIQIFIIVLFVFFKIIRPPVLNSLVPNFVKITLLSLPNFFEAIIGVFVLTGLGLLLNDRINKKHQLSPGSIYILAVLTAAIFVITQELNYLNLRGNNTMDQNDLIFSVIGLIVGYLIVLNQKPRI